MILVILVFASFGVWGLILFIPIILYVLYEQLFKKEIIEYITADFNYAKKAYHRGYEVKRQRVDGVNWTQFNPYLKNPYDYIFKVIGISKDELYR